MHYEDTIERIEKTIEELCEENKTTPILVEGEKDVAALRKLGISGEIIRVNSGSSISTLCDRLSSKYTQIIILTDWDEKGGKLFAIIKKNLRGRVACITRYRDAFATHSSIRTIEGLPSWIQTIQNKNR